MSMSMTVSGADRSPLERWKDGGWEKAAAAWSAKVEPVAANLVKLLAPVGLGPTAGQLRDSVSSRIESDDGVTSVVIYSLDPVAGYVIGGTGPHVILPHPRTRGGWTGEYTGRPGVGQHSLHWFAGGEDVFAWMVHHPGTKPNNWPERALEPFRPLLAEYFLTAVQEAMEL